MLTFKTSGSPKQQSLIFLHGFLGQKEDFDLTISYLEDLYYCITIDLDISMCANPFQYITSKITFLMNQMQLKQPILVGYSMGGRIAHVFQHLSEIFCRTILIGSHLGIQNMQERLDRITWEQTIEKSLDSLSVQDFIENWYNQPIFSRFKTHHYFQDILEKRKKINLRKMKNLFVSFQLTKQPIFPPHSSSHFFCGKYDNKYIQYYQSKKIFHHIIDRAGHVVHLENPEGLAEKIKEVLHGNKLEIRR